MRKEAIFLASEALTKRIGVEETRYKTPEGKYIISEKDLRQIRFSMTPDEYVNGFDVEQISDEYAEQLKKSCTLGSAGNKNKKNKEK